MSAERTSTSLTTQPPGGLLRLLLRLPIWLYRWHLGWLLGSRFVMIDHVGRKSGKAYQTVVEVVKHDADSDAYYVASGWGYEASWYQNLMARPETTIHSGRRTLRVRAETLTPDEGVQILLDYRQQHKFAARELSRVMGKDIAHSTPQQLEATVKSSLPIVVFRQQRS